ncbi:GlxA family transcriptional regulator [Arcobacter sp. CECT 8985]|uniref:GlxA family transcriptional regulator n=1 Tax=Arcobacter sp. CECT 8985 TaxID=1935424 RepID=UPI00100BFBA1|nr:helix-turn-helix domain-containing protein [Arcobacter sp. CECT 8985]RXJ87348.1 hypothetical protein CRU93_04415 [Arcobacter sp. CECT 8985]
MKIAILILKNVLKSAAFGIEDIFMINNNYCKAKDEQEIKTTFVSLEKSNIFDTKILNFEDVYDVVIIPPKLRDNCYIVDKKIIKWLVFQHSKNAILASACIGSFILAQTKLLDNKKATTHWAYEDKFKKEFPNIKLDVDKILIEQKNIITAGGINAYIDLCLYIVEKFHSNRTATQLANLMIIDRGRVSQKSYKSFSTIFLYDDKEIKNIIEWMKNNLNEQISVSLLAQKVNLTDKTFTRRFKKAINSSPIQYLKNLRVEKAKELLISTEKKLSEITLEIGYFDENSFRKLFKKQTSLNPKEYRKKFKQTL